MVVFPQRAAAAAETRRRVISAAGTLFVTRGWTGTTVDAIAEAAGVARATVFTAVPGGKPALLKAARDVALAGDAQPVRVSERPWFRRAMAAEDGVELLRRQARNYALINGRASGLDAVLMSASASDPDLTQMRLEAQGQRRTGCRLVVQRLDALGSPRLRSSVPYSTDALYALAGPGPYLQLTMDCGWSPGRYERWLAATMIASLLRA